MPISVLPKKNNLDLSDLGRSVSLFNVVTEGFWTPFKNMHPSTSFNVGSWSSLLEVLMGAAVKHL